MLSPVSSSRGNCHFAQGCCPEIKSKKPACCQMHSSQGPVIFYRWLYEGISREKAEELLFLPYNYSGSFLIRESQTRKGRGVCQAMAQVYQNCQPKRREGLRITWMLQICNRSLGTLFPTGTRLMRVQWFPLSHTTEGLQEIVWLRLGILHPFSTPQSCLPSQRAALCSWGWMTVKGNTWLYVPRTQCYSYCRNWWRRLFINWPQGLKSSMHTKPNWPMNTPEVHR